MSHNVIRALLAVAILSALACASSGQGAGKGVDSTTSRRRVNEGFALVIYEIEGLAVSWVTESL